LRVNVSRIRRKLAPLDWRIDTRQGSTHRAGWYRIVPLADAEGRVA